MPYTSPAPNRVTRSNSQRNPRLSSVYQLAQHHQYEATHAHQVTRLATRLFDELQKLHGLGPKQRFWLTAAGLLHDIGWINGGKGHHKSSLRLIVDTTLLTWPARQRLVVGCIARYHRKSLPKDSHAHFAALKRQDQQDVCVLAGLLRVADGLDRTHRSVVCDLVAVVKPQQLVIRCQVSGTADLEQTKALQKADLLESVFDRGVVIQCQHQ